MIVFHPSVQTFHIKRWKKCQWVYTCVHTSHPVVNFSLCVSCIHPSAEMGVLKDRLRCGSWGRGMGILQVMAARWSLKRALSRCGNLRQLSWVRHKSILKFCFDFQKASQIHRDRQKSFTLKKIEGLGKLSRWNCLWTPDKSRTKAHLDGHAQRVYSVLFSHVERGLGPVWGLSCADPSKLCVKLFCSWDEKAK